MIHLLPVLRFPWRRRRPATAPVAVAEPRTPVVEPNPAPAWAHRPPEGTERAEKCGQCGVKMPDGAPTPEFCSAPCQGSWTAAFINWLNAEAKWRRDGDMNPVHTCEPPAATGPRLVPELPPEPSWLAAIIQWDHKRTQRVIDSRKAPSSGEVAA